MNFITELPTQLVIVVAALCQILKDVGVPSKFLPLISVALGVGVWQINNLNSELISAIMIGVVATGGFSMIKEFATKTASDILVEEELEQEEID